MVAEGWKIVNKQKRALVTASVVSINVPIDRVKTGTQNFILLIWVKRLLPKGFFRQKWLPDDPVVQSSDTNNVMM